MEREAIEKFLMEKKEYEQSDMAEFWEWYLQADPNFEFTERELDILIEEKWAKAAIDWEGIDSIFETVDRLYSEEETERILKRIRKEEYGIDESVELNWKKFFEEG